MTAEYERGSDVGGSCVGFEWEATKATFVRPVLGDDVGG
jgi:hypothetical protein